MEDNKLLEKIKNEFNIAKKAQSEGKTGMVRVCARRAAGWAIQLKLNENGIDLNTLSAFDYIKYYNDQENVDPEIKNTLEYLQVKVKKDALDEEAYWPIPDVDLIHEAKQLVEKLIGLKI